VMESVQGFSKFQFTVLYAILSGCAPIIASFIPVILAQRGGVSPLFLHLMLSVSAGLLFAIATLDLIPSALSMGEGEGHRHSAHADDHPDDSHGPSPMVHTSLFLSLSLSEGFFFLY
jgi:hypothetical protein